METATRIGAVERACQAEADRNIAPLVRYAAGGLSDAAHSIADARNPSVVVLTGAYIPWAKPPAAETDGPPGAVLLATGLQQLGVPARLLTDHRCLPVVAAAEHGAVPGVSLDVCDGDPAEVERLLEDYERLEVTHVVAVERMGPAVDGIIRNFRGDDVTAFTAPLDRLFEQERPWTTVGVGDGGNELGMGNLPSSAVAAAIDHGELIHCAIGCDHLIVAGVSNWGA